MESCAKLQIFLADFSEFGGDSVELGGDSNYARDGDADDGDGEALAARNGLKGKRGVVLD